MAEADRLTIAGGVAGITLMENAGRAVAEHVAARHPPGSRIVVVAGPGNNGGDGFVAARMLAERGHRGAPAAGGSRERLAATRRSRRSAGRDRPRPPEPERARCPPMPSWMRCSGPGSTGRWRVRRVPLIEAMNAAPRVYAVDLPSGINGTTGAVMGVAVKAAETVTFFRRKLGHVLLPGRLHCGATHVADIGIPPSVLAAIKPRAFVNAPAAVARRRFRCRAPAGTNTSRGHAVVVSGGMSSTGAARLAARGALRAGAGLVTIAEPARGARGQRGQQPRRHGASGRWGAASSRRSSPMRAATWWCWARAAASGAEMRELVLAALAGTRAVVLDADALTSFADEPQR